MHTDCGVFGGWPYLAYEYIMKIVSVIIVHFYLKIDFVLCRVV